MNVATFLISLPAILGLCGFIAYQLLGTHKDRNDIVKTILSKVRRDSPERASELEGLTTRQVTQKLKLDDGFRAIVSEQDFLLLQAVSRQEFIKALSVYILIGLLFLVSVVAYVILKMRPEGTTMSAWSIQSDGAQADGLAVDLDPLVLTWVTEGPSKDIEVYLENVQTRQRTEPVKTTTSQQRLQFSKQSYRSLLANRQLYEHNRIRAVARAENQTFVSPEFGLLVGIVIQALVDEEKSQIILAALIDNCRVDGYNFEAKVLGYRNPVGEGPETWGGNVRNGRGDFPVEGFPSVRWDTAKVVYFGPDSLNIVRTQISY